jgi:hypothetical protein
MNEETTMKMQTIALSVLCSGVSLAQIVIPDGTKLRVRLDQTLSSATAEEGQPVELTLADAVKVNDVVVLKEGAKVTGTVTEANPKRRMGRAGKLDFSIDRAMAADGQWVPLRYTLQKKSGNSHVVRTGVITAGVAVFVPFAAPVVLLMKGKDIIINKGQTFEVFTDSPYSLALKTLPGGATPVNTQAAVATPAQTTALEVPAAGPATITVTSSAAGADIEVNGTFMGNTPTTLQLPPGKHQITVKSGLQTWGRSIQVTGGSTVSLHAVLTQATPVAQTR